jgi:hypothetical protein
MAPIGRPAISQLAIHFPEVMNDQGRPMIWFGSWLVGQDGREGEWFHSARGGAVVRVARPPEATGLRIRRWPSDGLDAEYADVLDLASAASLDADSLDFDTRQRYSLLPEDFG